MIAAQFCAAARERDRDERPVQERLTRLLDELTRGWRLTAVRRVRRFYSTITFRNVVRYARHATYRGRDWWVEAVAMLSARELRELAEIAEQLQRSDCVLARRLRRHRVRLSGLGGLGVAHPMAATLLLCVGMVAVAVVGLGLLTTGLTTGAGALVVTGTVVLALVPYIPVLFVRWRSRAAWRGPR